MLRPTVIGAALAASAFAARPPADRLPAPRPEPCLPFEADDDESFSVPGGLDHDAVTLAPGRVIQTAPETRAPAPTPTQK